jgi:ABC-type transporter Mla subunit MlaD
MEIKKAEIATSDLVTLVRASNLSSRELLADLLEQFTRDARRTAQRLQRLNAKFNGGMDMYVPLSSLRVRC